MEKSMENKTPSDLYQMKSMPIHNLMTLYKCQTKGTNK